MRRLIPVALGVVALSSASAALGQTPAERAGALLERQVARDRLLDAAREARGDATEAPARLEQLERDRASLQPEVGRPEQAGRTPDVQRSTGADRNVTR